MAYTATKPSTDSDFNKKFPSIIDELEKFPINQIVYENVYAVTEQHPQVNVLRLLVFPKQGLRPLFVNFEDGRKWDKDKECYKLTLTYHESGKYYIPLSEPIKVTLDEARTNIPLVEQHVQEVERQIREKEKELRESSNKEFKDNNAIPPRPKELYLDDTVWNMACACINLDKYPLFLGPKGCGKTETAKSLAKAMGMKFYPFNMGQAVKAKEYFVGVMQARENKNGNVETVLFESEFLKAYQAPAEEPTLIFLDELTRIPQAAANLLMQIIDRNMNRFWVPELGRYIERGAGVHFMAAGNIGMQYTDTRTMDGAFMDRFISLTVDYLPEHEELQLISERAPKANQKQIKELIVKANKCREEERNGNLTSGISTRKLIDMAHFLERGFTLEQVFDSIFLNCFINGNNNEIVEVKNIVQS